MRVFFCSHVTLLTRGCLVLIRYGFLGLGLIGAGLLLYSLSLMRPCDGTSGLVRGNRRKAVFAFRGCFPKDIFHVFALGQRIYIAYFGSEGKIGNRRAQPDFRQQNRRSRERKTGVGRPISVLPRISGIAARKYAANSGTN